MATLDSRQEAAVCRLLEKLISQNQARILVRAERPEPGFWFGGGNMLRDDDGTVWLCGRYRNAGDSRTGLAAGLRGLECAIFRSETGGRSFKKAMSWIKSDLSRGGRKVLSIEGTALHRMADGSVELFISSEKEIRYPEPLARYQKPGTGVWTIDRIAGRSVAELDASTLAPVVENAQYPEYLHVKDPVVFDDATGNTVLLFCSHPFCWSSGNTGMAVRSVGQAGFSVRCWEFVSRGPAWDVASTRITARMPIPRVGCFRDGHACSVYFYDGCECVRAHQQNEKAHKRPRGYSCEELGGAFVGWDNAFPELARLSRLAPLFVSPWGTGCSRYVDTLTTEDGIVAAWQQSQRDGSQPLVGHVLPMDEIRDILGA
ncbi:MAG: exo-alpha-sialidase [Kiritimatiellae bacterium]|nr:exo-alpha-sialidase [Kiritimatiellia bacterium]